MSITINTKAFTTRRILPDQTLAVGPAYTGDVRDDFILFRKESVKDRAGVWQANKPRLNRVKSVVVDSVSGKKELATLGLSGTFPYGMSSADKLEMLADIVAAGGLQEFKDLFTTQDIQLP